MFGICIESSHTKGMGHLFRILNFIKYLRSMNTRFIVFVNDDPVAVNIIKSNNLAFEIVDLSDLESNWESNLIKKYSIDIWINDRLDTDIAHSLNVKKNNIKLVTLDDMGSGSELADINFCAMAFDSPERLKGKKILTGIKYLILNDEIAKHKRVRKKIENILVTLGGADTYGVTIKIVKIMSKSGISAAVITGPSFIYKDELSQVVNDLFTIKEAVPSLIEEFYNFDLAITGGGITPFEANASGLPCIIVANEPFEIGNGKFLERLGTSTFAGYYKEVRDDFIDLNLDIEKMSATGIRNIKLNGAENIFRQIQSL